ncbi:MAG: extradiol dioxygenase [Brevundimonas sp.]|uniref:VOC family protein n=1 Tax=Brevundimonas sp. TaxID=1871086 RepID=UPI000DB8130E|nr:VOC family protein [Brevundimonas sp.]PZT98443.1 MAG: extradiol dioxygenase [Brevundimonas sp.]
MSRIGAISLLVHDYDAAIAFYVGKLGFGLSEDTDMGGGKRWVRVTPQSESGRGETSLLLARATTGAQKAQVGKQAGGRVWLFLETDDLLRDHAAWLAAGVHFRETPRHETYGKVVVFEDLYGNAWDLIEPATGA